MKKAPLLLCLIILTTFFLLLEMSFFIQCNKIYLSDFTFVTDKLAIPWKIVPTIIYFIALQLLIHIVYCLGIWSLTWLIANLFRLSSQACFSFGIFAWTFGIITLITANVVLFPNAKFSVLISLDRDIRFIAQPLLTMQLSIWVIAFFLSIVSLGNMIFTKAGVRLASVLLLFLLAITGWFLYDARKVTFAPAPGYKQPNVILIGIDSLRPDFLSFFGAANQTPVLDALLDKATVFAEAMTPLARTFPSWTSILTGKHPKSIGIRTNLAPQEQIQFDQSLPNLLRCQGYETIYATDETRFSNIDKNYGFDQVIAPPMGLNDFLIGTFNDFLLSNLLINTQLGRWLFPYSYANRPVYFSYDPNSFLMQLKPMLSRERTKPLFLSVHFCLPHFPYLWSGWLVSTESVTGRYVDSITRVDKQIGDFFILLQKNHLLDHAIVVILSDHGEALALPGDRITEKQAYLLPKLGDIPPHFYPFSSDEEGIDISIGHGTDVLGLPQYHSVLAFKMYGVDGMQQAGVLPGIVSLMDIHPTILALLQLSPGPTDGQSLMPWIFGESQMIPLRHILVESDFSPDAIHTVYPETRQVMLEGIQLFRIHPKTMRLIVKDKMVDMIIKSKQFADYYGEWVLALYPQNESYRLAILVNLKTGQWTNDLQSAFAVNSPVQQMLDALKTFYGKEIGDIHQS